MLKGKLLTNKLRFSMLPSLFNFFNKPFIFARCNNEIDITACLSETLAEFELHKNFSQSKLKISIEIIVMKFLIDFILSCKLFLDSKPKYCIEVLFLLDELDICTGQVNIYR